MPRGIEQFFVCSYSAEDVFCTIQSVVDGGSWEG
jgi:hypothetical protein